MVYGRGVGIPTGELSRTLHGGGTIVLPILQDYRYLSLEPMQVHLLNHLQDELDKLLVCSGWPWYYALHQIYKFHTSK